MSSTRTAKLGSAPRQERFASSARLRKGLLGNLVARRCEALKSPCDRQLVYFLHELSLRDGFAVHRSCNLFPAWPWQSEGPCNESALERVARELVELWPRRIKSHANEARTQIADFLPKLCLDPRIDFSTANVPAFEGLRPVTSSMTRHRKGALHGRKTSQFINTLRIVRKLVTVALRHLREP